MTASRDPDRLIRAFLSEGEEQLHDQVYDAVRAHIERKPQRVVIGPWRTPIMNRFATIAVGAAAVVVLLVVGSQLLGPPTPDGLGAGSATSSPAPIPGGRLAYGRFSPGGTHVFTAKTDGTDEQALLPSIAEGPRFSPDGRRLAVNVESPQGL